MTFRSSGIADAGDGQFRMTGLLRIKDVELPVHLDLRSAGADQGTRGPRRLGFEGTAVIRHSDWGLDWNTALVTGGVLVSDRVRLRLGISAVRLDRARAAD